MFFNKSKACNQTAKLSGMGETRLYATRFWNNLDKYAGITEWSEDSNFIYEEFGRLSGEYDNAELIENIVHSISGRGEEACNCPPKNEYGVSKIKEVVCFS